MPRYIKKSFGKKYIEIMLMYQYVWENTYLCINMYGKIHTYVSICMGKYMLTYQYVWELPIVSICMGKYILMYQYVWESTCLLYQYDLENTCLPIVSICMGKSIITRKGLYIFSVSSPGRIYGYSSLCGWQHGSRR